MNKTSNTCIALRKKQGSLRGYNNTSFLCEQLSFKYNHVMILYVFFVSIQFNITQECKGVLFLLKSVLYCVQGDRVPTLWQHIACNYGQHSGYYGNIAVKNKSDIESTIITGIVCLFS